MYAPFYGRQARDHIGMSLLLLLLRLLLLLPRGVKTNGRVADTHILKHTHTHTHTDTHKHRKDNGYQRIGESGPKDHIFVVSNIS